MPRRPTRSKPPAQSAPEPARAVAVIDCGTTSVRAYIAELGNPAHGGEPRILEDLQHPVDLAGAFTSGMLGHEGMDAVVDGLTGIVRSAMAYRIDHIRAVGTSALREAGNTDILVERVRTSLGITIEVLGAAETARLYAEALRRLFARERAGLSGDTLFLDLGGGGTCAALLRDGKLVFSADEHVGTQRTLELFKALRDGVDFAVTIDRFMLGVARVIMGRMPRSAQPRVVVNGGDVRRLAAHLAGGDDPETLALLPRERLDGWYRTMEAMNTASRAEAVGGDVDDADTLLAACCLVRHLCAETGADAAIVPQLTLRDGLLADLAPGALGPHHVDRSHLVAEARSLAARYGSNLPYVENTASLAGQIFAQTTALHGLGEREGLLLELAALLHDVGSFINARERHKHSQYIIGNADLAGLTDHEQELVAHIARYHRRSAPQPHHTEFMALARRDRVVVVQLAAILRLAYALDVERSQRIRKVAVRIAPDRVLLQVDRRQIALERWSLEGKSRLFAELFGLPVTILPREDK